MRRTTQLIFGVAAAALLVFSGAGCTAKMKAAHHLHRAEQYFAAGQYAQAEIEFKNVLRNAPQSAGAWAGLGIIYFNEGRLSESAPVLARAKQVDPENLEVRVKLGIILLGMGRIQEARDEADYVLERNSRQAQAPVLLANTAVTTNDLVVIRQRLQELRQKEDSAPLEVAWGTLAVRGQDFKTAEASFNRAAELNPQCHDAFTALGCLYLSQKDLKQADAAFQKAAELSPVWSGNGLRYAQFKLLAGDSAKAEQMLRDMVGTTPDYLPAWMALVQMAASRNDYTNALVLLNNVLSRAPKYYEGLMQQGRLELLRGDAGKAITSFERLIKMFPQASSAYYLLAQAYLADQQTDKARDSLVQALNLNPKYADASLLLAMIQIKSGHTAAAIVSLKQLIKEQPRVESAWLLLADAYRVQGMPGSAIKIYQELEKAQPGNPQIPLMLGTSQLQQKQNAEARAEFERALQLAPDYMPALERLVELDLLEKKYPAALQRVEPVALKNPGQAAIQILLGKVLAAQGETNRAEAAWSKAVALQPDSSEAYLLLTRLHIETGQKQKAMTELKTALARHPNDLTALMLMSSLCQSEKDYENARETYEKILSIFPNNGVALNNLACLYADHLNQLDKAYPLARRAREAAPANPTFADTLGWVLYRKGQYGPALALLRESAGQLDAVPAVQFHLGMAGYMTGNEAEARTAFQRALQLPGEFQEKDECRQRLAVLDIDAQKAGADTCSWLKKWAASHPDDPVALSRLAVVYQRQGMTNEAIAAWQSMLKASPQNVTTMVNLARLYAPTDAQKAYAFAKSAYQLAPNDSAVTYQAGRLAFVVGDYSWALSLLQLTARARPHDPEVLFDLGEAFYSQGRVPEARTTMQNALQTGVAFARAGDARQFLAVSAPADAPAEALAAQAQVQEILKSNPDDVPALMATAVVAEQKADVTAAEQTYQQVLKHYPDFAPAQKQLAILYAKDPGNDSKAYDLAIKARQAFPNDREIAKTLGVILYRRGDYVRAVQLLQSNMDAKKLDPETMYYLGMAEYRLKHVAECKVALQQAVDLNLSGKPAAEARLILAELKTSR